MSYYRFIFLIFQAHFAKLEGLGGVTLSSIGMDDVDGQCGQGSYPLLHAVANVFGLNTNEQSRMKRKFHLRNIFLLIYFS